MGTNLKLNEIKTDIEVIKTEIINLKNSVNKVSNDHESRLRILEQFKNKISGIASIIGLFTGLIGAIVGGLIQRLLR